MTYRQIILDILGYLFLGTLSVLLLVASPERWASHPVDGPMILGMAIFVAGCLLEEIVEAIRNLGRT